MTFDSEGMKRVYTTKVNPEEILYVVLNMTRLHEQGKNPGYENAMFILTDRYKKRRNAAQKCFVIMQRIHCLLRILESKDDRMRSWTVDAADPDCMLTDQAVFTATALCPMRRQNGRAYFHPDEFFDIVLRESEPEGKA